jgi:hypothetical protein
MPSILHLDPLRVEQSDPARLTRLKAGWADLSQYSFERFSPSIRKANESGYLDKTITDHDFINPFAFCKQFISIFGVNGFSPKPTLDSGEGGGIRYQDARRNR